VNVTSAIRYRLDAFLGLIAIAFGAVSITFPFGRDHGLQHYVGREWLHGAVPYKEVFDQSAPGTYALHAISMLLFGAGTHAIRLAELAAIIPLGLAAGALAAPAGKPLPDGLRGTAMLTASVFLYGFFGFWDTAQGHATCATLIVCSLWAASRLRRDRAALVSGVLCSVAVLIKPAILPTLFVVVALLVEGEKTRRRMFTWRALGTFTLAAAAVPGLGLIYFAAKGALGDAYDLLYDARCLYRPAVSLPREVIVDRVFQFFASQNPLSGLLATLFVFGLVWATHRRDRRRLDQHLVVLGLGVATLAAIRIQADFYLASWAFMIGPAALLGANVAASGALLAKTWSRPVVAAFSFQLLALYATTDAPSSMWLVEFRGARDLVLGQTDRRSYAKLFNAETLAYFSEDRRLIAEWLRAHSRPNDRVLVRGFEPEIYAMAERSYGARFFWTAPITTNACAYRRWEWIADDRAQIARVKPRYVVALSRAQFGPDAPSTFVSMGYVLRTTMFDFAILEAGDNLEKP
jgi:4-amino-4-deoxy-L-arabinose transferase-like glycosyltransferase